MNATLLNVTNKLKSQLWQPSELAQVRVWMCLCVNWREQHGWSFIQCNIAKCMLSFGCQNCSCCGNDLPLELEFWTPGKICACLVPACRSFIHFVNVPCVYFSKRMCCLHLHLWWLTIYMSSTTTILTSINLMVEISLLKFFSEF